MRIFEYKVDHKNCAHHFTRDSDDETKYLNLMGLEGWELVGVVSNAPTTHFDSTNYYWKREVIK